MCIFSLLVLAAEIPPQSPLVLVGEKDGQRALFRMFFADVKPGARNFLARDCPDDPEDFLRWSGLTLKQGAVLWVEYDTLPFLGNLNIHTLPHSVARITIVKSRQNYSIQTRMLPKKLESLTIYENEIFGAIDLKSLPTDLTILIAFSNRICGPIDLTSLPKSLKNMNLTFNSIDQKVVLYGNIPQSVERIYLGYQQKVENGIKAARPISAEDALEKKRFGSVFRGLVHYDAWPSD